MPTVSIEKRIREMEADELWEFMHGPDSGQLTPDQFWLCNQQYAQINGELLPHLNIED